MFVNYTTKKILQIKTILEYVLKLFFWLFWKGAAMTETPLAIQEFDTNLLI